MELNRRVDKTMYIIFIFFMCLMLALSCLPGIFDWSNTIKPWVLGMPFASFWQLLLSTLGIIGIGVFYLIENARKTLDWKDEFTSEESEID